MMRTGSMFLDASDNVAGRSYDDITRSPLDGMLTVRGQPWKSAPPSNYSAPQTSLNDYLTERRIQRFAGDHAQKYARLGATDKQIRDIERGALQDLYTKYGVGPPGRLANSTRELENSIPKFLRPVADFARVASDQATLGLQDNLLGMLSSYADGTDFTSAHAENVRRTERAQERLGPYGSAAANAVGLMTTLPLMMYRLPAWALRAGRGGVLMPAMLPLEATHGFISTPGDVGTRAHGALDRVVDAPLSVLNPMTGRGMFSQMAADASPGMLGYRFSNIGGDVYDWLAAQYARRPTTAAGIGPMVAP